MLKMTNDYEVNSIIWHVKPVHYEHDIFDITLYNLSKTIFPHKSCNF